MRKTLGAVLALCALAACGGMESPQEQGSNEFLKTEGRLLKAARPVPGQYIVVLKEEAPGRPARPVPEVAQELAARHGAQVMHTYQHALRGFSIRGGEAQARALAATPGVDYVEEDGEVHGASTQSSPPWGLDRIDQRYRPLNGIYQYGGLTGSGVNAYILDSGILAGHADFGGRVSLSFTSIHDGWGAGDCHGHGTHVAGTVGSATYGVAKGVGLHSVRVLDCNNTGSWAGVIAGVDWVRANHVKPAVANMSLGGGANAAVDQAVQNAIAAGIPFTLSAGNDNVDACGQSPARVAQALTVGATDSADNRASFSNHGGCVDLFAPGVDILSTYNNGGTAWMSGTSMAAPHVAGVAALHLQRMPWASPAAVSSAILGSSSWGLVGNPTHTSNRLLHSRVSPKAQDFDGDGRSDLAIWRPGTAEWWHINSFTGAGATQQWGWSSDRLVPADYDGDGRTDHAVWRPSNGTWYILYSAGGSVTYSWGLNGDIPVPADFNGDGRADYCVWRPSNATWYVTYSSGGGTTVQWGWSEDAPVPADFNGDGRADFAVWRPGNGHWYITYSSGGSWSGQWGLTGDVPVPADHDGDGRADLAVWRPSTAQWWYIRSLDGGSAAPVWGVSSDRPVKVYAK